MSLFQEDQLLKVSHNSHGLPNLPAGRRDSLTPFLMQKDSSTSSHCKNVVTPHSAKTPSTHVVMYTTHSPCSTPSTSSPSNQLLLAGHKQSRNNSGSLMATPQNNSGVGTGDHSLDHSLVAVSMMSTPTMEGASPVYQTHATPNTFLSTYPTVSSTRQSESAHTTTSAGTAQTASVIGGRGDHLSASNNSHHPNFTKPQANQAPPSYFAIAQRGARAAAPQQQDHPNDSTGSTLVIVSPNTTDGSSSGGRGVDRTSPSTSTLVCTRRRNTTHQRPFAERTHPVTQSANNPTTSSLGLDGAHPLEEETPSFGSNTADSLPQIPPVSQVASSTSTTIHGKVPTSGSPLDSPEENRERPHPRPRGSIVSAPDDGPRVDALSRQSSYGNQKLLEDAFTGHSRTRSGSGAEGSYSSADDSSQLSEGEIIQPSTYPKTPASFALTAADSSVDAPPVVTPIGREAPSANLPEPLSFAPLLVGQQAGAPTQLSPSNSVLSLPNGRPPRPTSRSRTSSLPPPATTTQVHYNPNTAPLVSPSISGVRSHTAPPVPQKSLYIPLPANLTDGRPITNGSGIGSTLQFVLNYPPSSTQQQPLVIPVPDSLLRGSETKGVTGDVGLIPTFPPSVNLPRNLQLPFYDPSVTGSVATMGRAQSEHPMAVSNLHDADHAPRIFFNNSPSTDSGGSTGTLAGGQGYVSGGILAGGSAQGGGVAEAQLSSSGHFGGSFHSERSCFTPFQTDEHPLAAKPMANGAHSMLTPFSLERHCDMGSLAPASANLPTTTISHHHPMQATQLPIQPAAVVTPGISQPPPQSFGLHQRTVTQDELARIQLLQIQQSQQQRQQQQQSLHSQPRPGPNVIQLPAELQQQMISHPPQKGVITMPLQQLQHLQHLHMQTTKIAPHPPPTAAMPTLATFSNPMCVTQLETPRANSTASINWSASMRDNTLDSFGTELATDFANNSAGSSCPPSGFGTSSGSTTNFFARLGQPVQPVFPLHANLLNTNNNPSKLPPAPANMFKHNGLTQTVRQAPIPVAGVHQGLRGLAPLAYPSQGVNAPKTIPHPTNLTALQGNPQPQLDLRSNQNGNGTMSSISQALNGGVPVQHPVQGLWMSNTMSDPNLYSDSTESNGRSSYGYF